MGAGCVHSYNQCSDTGSRNKTITNKGREDYYNRERKKTGRETGSWNSGRVAETRARSRCHRMDEEQRQCVYVYNSNGVSRSTVASAICPATPPAIAASSIIERSREKWIERRSEDNCCSHSISLSNGAFSAACANRAARCVSNSLLRVKVAIPGICDLRNLVRRVEVEAVIKERVRKRRQRVRTKEARM